MSWTLLHTKHWAFSADDHSKSYLVGGGEHLIAVVVGSRGESIRVLKFNENLKVWQCVPHLKGQVVFLSSPSSITMSCKELGVPWLDNTIHFARFHERHNVFYSLSTAKFHLMGNNKYASHDLLGTNIPLNCTWIPNFHYLSDRQLDWSNPDAPSLEEEEEEEEEEGRAGEEITEEEGLVEQEAAEAETERPWIVMSHGEKAEEKITFVDLATGVYHSKETSSMEERLRGKRVYGHGYGRVLLMDLEARDCVVFNTKSMAFDSLPTWEKRENFVYRCCLLHMPADGSEFMVVIFGEAAGEGVAMLCGVGDKEWTISEGGGQVFVAASYRGRIYGIGTPPGSKLRFLEIKLRPNYGVKVIQQIQVMQRSPKGCGDIKRYLVESRGELLFFHQDFAGDFHTNRNAHVILDVRVFKIDVKKMRMEEVEDLGDRAFFFAWSSGAFQFTGSGGFGCCASKFGFKRNAIYLVYPRDSNLYIYDYGDRSVLVTSSCPELEQCSMHQLVMCHQLV
ncbi:unnamed protein product [Linum tenue]|uniref:KIB1-4 beta-propeller domain-containing protein n=1 Tax=Linum tenue TaxID=586396 RepID=A0AAV0NUG3_9ROSI|nr:unnamed protein product [Linum tenue]